MKIFILADSGTIHTQRWVKALADRGCLVHLFSLRSKEKEFYDNIENVTFSSLEMGKPDSLMTKLKYPLSIRKIKHLIKEFNPDIVHAHYASSYGFLSAVTRSSCPLIISVWGSDVYDFPKQVPFGAYILKFNFKRADYIFSTSHVMAKETRTYTDKPISITPFGVDVELFRPSKLKKTDIFIIGNVKSLWPKYGIDVLIRAVNIVIRNNPEKKIRLDIYGKGPQKDELVSLTKKLGIEDKVNFKGFVRNNLLPDIYNSFSVAVSTSILDSESFGVVAVEAMACGCPVVTSDADGFTEVVENNETGYIVPKRNPEATAHAIQRFIDNPQLGELMGAKGRKRVMERYNWDENVSLMMNIYHDVIRTNDK